MTIKFSDVKVGDRVHLVNENGDEATTVALRVMESGIESMYHYFWGSDGWSVTEIIQPEFVFPTKPWAVIRHSNSDEMYTRDESGVWWSSMGLDWPEDSLRTITEGTWTILNPGVDA